MMLDVFTAPRRNAKVWTAKTMSWDEFTGLLAPDRLSDRKDCGGYVLGRFAGSQRTREAVQGRCALTLDADYALPDFPDRIRELPFQAAAHTTFSSTPETPRYRLVIPLDREVNPEEYRRAARAVMKRLGEEQFDKTCDEPERFMYLPAAENPEDYVSIVTEGPLASADDLLRSVDPVTRVLEALEACGSKVVPQGPADWMAQCPAHVDHTPSLHIAWNGKDQRVLMHDFGAARCTTENILKAIGLEWTDLFSSPPTASSAKDDFAAPADGWADASLRSHQRIAARFAQYARGSLLWVHGGGWHAWDGRRWAPDHHNTRAHAVLEEVLRISWDEARGDKALLQDVRASMSASGSQGVLALASTKLFAQDVDIDPYLLNCQNGTLDLHTMRLKPHDPADMITKITGASFNPNAEGRVWEPFLASSLPDPDVREFLQRYAGVALIGKVVEQVMVIATGVGRNGKGVIARSIARALGDYAVTASSDMLTVGRRGYKSAGELSAIMSLRGARWADMSELDSDARMNESLMKTLTGGDVITAKLMGKDFVEFQPSHSFYLMTNSLPAMDAESEASWGRVRVIPFDVSFLGREDVTLEDRISLELEAVLAWAVQGLVSYQLLGLTAPKAVLVADELYRQSNDPAGRFISEECVLSQEASVTSAELFSAYNEWASSNGEKMLSMKSFGAALRRVHGVAQRKSHGTRGYTGIGLVSELGNTKRTG